MPGDCPGQGGAFHPLHGQVGLRFGLAEVIDAEDVRVADIPGQDDLLPESLQNRIVFGVLGPQQLDRYLNLEQLVVSLVNDPGGPFAGK